MNTGTRLSWDNAVLNNKIQGYLSYYDSSARKYKYVSSPDLGMPETNLTPNVGYWLYANQSGNLTLPSVGGSLSGQTYAWSKLRFFNGTMELNITSAGTAGWIGENGNVNGNVLWYSGIDPDTGLFGYLRLCSSISICAKNNISSWEGVFVNSLKDNITLVRQN